MKKRDERIILIAILAAGALIRVFHLLFWYRTPYWNGLFLDELYHHIWAKSIVDSGPMPSGVFFRAPLYPYLLSMFYAIFGNGGLAPRIFQHVVGIITAIAVFYTVERVVAGRVWAYLAALLWVLNPIQVFFESRLLLDSLFACGVVWLIYLALITKEERKYYFVTGIVLGFLAILRPTVLVFVPVIIFFLWGGKKSAILKLIVGIILPIIPVTLSNLANGDFVLIASQGGINFYIGNNPKSDGSSAVVPEFGWNWRYSQCVKLAEKNIGRKLKPSHVSRYYFKKGLKFIISNPLRAIKLYIKKLALLVGAREIGNNGSIKIMLQGSVLKYFLWIGWGLIFPLGIFGIIFGKLRHKTFFIAAFFVYFALLLAFFVCSRFRLPLVAVLLPLAASGAKQLWLEIKNKNIYKLLVFAILLTLPQVISSKLFTDEKSIHYFSLGNIYLRSGRLDKALAQYKKVLKVNSLARGVNLNIGALYFRLGLVDSAEHYFREEVAVGGEVCRALSNIGALKRLQGELDSALIYGSKAYKMCSDEPAVAFNYIKALLSSKNFIEAAKAADTIAKQFSDEPALLNICGVAKLRASDTAAAESLFVKAFEAKPKLLVEQYELGTIYSQRSGLAPSLARSRAMALFNLSQIVLRRGGKDSAKVLLSKCISTDSTLAVAFGAMGAIYLSEGKLDSAYFFLKSAENKGLKAPELFFNIASVHARKGEFTNAVLYLKKAVDADSTFQLARDALKSIRKFIP